MAQAQTAGDGPRRGQQPTATGHWPVVAPATDHFFCRLSLPVSSSQRTGARVSSLTSSARRARRASAIVLESLGYNKVAAPEPNDRTVTTSDSSFGFAGMSQSAIGYKTNTRVDHFSEVHTTSEAHPTTGPQTPPTAAGDRLFSLARSRIKLERRDPTQRTAHRSIRDKKRAPPPTRTSAHKAICTPVHSLSSRASAHLRCRALHSHSPRFGRTP